MHFSKVGIKLGLILSCGITTTVLATTSMVATENNTSGTPSKVSINNTHKTMSMSQIKDAKFSIPESSPLTISLLNDCWKNREDTTNQKIIADYLMTTPDVPEDYEIAWKTARLVYFIGNYGVGEKRFVDSDEGVKLFDYGAKAGLTAQKLNPNSVDGYYWYAIDLGSYGLAKGVLSAASGAKAGMTALKKSMALDPSFQWYGSSRILGRYYQELPGIFGGSSSKALTLIQASTTGTPKFRNNWVFLGQYYISEGEYSKALVACNTALSLPDLDGKYEEMRYTDEAKACVAKAQSKLD